LSYETPANRQKTEIEKCAFLVDSRMPSAPASQLEPDYAADEGAWEKVVCEPFLDAGATSMLARIAWLPESRFLPAALRKTWGEYCLLRRKA
jgi:alpha-1,2-mannosyltransferase